MVRAFFSGNMKQKIDFGKLADKFGTPLYVYDVNGMTDKIRDRKSVV